MTNKELLQQLAKMSHGKALKECLEEELKEIGDVDNAKTEAELIGRQLAKKTLKRIFSFLEEEKPKTKRKVRFS